MQKNTGLLIFNSLKQKKLIFNFVVNRNWKKLTDSRKKAKILADNRKRYHPIETLFDVDKLGKKSAFELKTLPSWKRFVENERRYSEILQTQTSYHSQTWQVY